MKMKTLRTCAMACALAAFAGFALGQDSYPSKPVSLVVPVPPGGIIDSVARMVGPGMTQALGQQIVVLNKPGAGGNIGAEFTARSAPDGYTLLVGYSMFHIGNRAMYSNLKWDPLRDFVSVGMVGISPHVMAVHPSVPAKTMRELVDYAKANPGKLNYASSGAGSVPHVGVELFKQQNGIAMTHVPYKGASPAVQDVVSGNAQVVVMTPPSMLGFVQSGRLRPLAVAGSKRLSQIPDVPTSAEAGYPAFHLEAWVALFAPAGTPPAVVAKLSEALKTALQTPEARKAADAAGIEIQYMPPAQLDNVVRQDYQRWGKVIREANIRAD